VKTKAFVPAANIYFKGGKQDPGYKVSSPSLYKASRKTELSQLVDSAKKRYTIGPGSFTPKTPQNHIPGSYDGLPRVTMAAAILAAGDAVPAPNRYDLPDFRVTRNEPRRTIIKGESEAEKQL